MSRMKRERNSGLKKAAEWLADYVMHLPVGSEYTMATLTDDCMAHHGYTGAESPEGYVYSKGSGETYLVTDYIELKEMLAEELRGKRELDSSMYALSLTGLPENIPFIIRESNGTPMMRVEISSGRSPKNADIMIYSNGRADVSYLESIVDVPRDTDVTVSMSDSIIRKINKVMQDPLIQKEQEEGYEKESGIAVMDGNTATVTFFCNDGEKEFTYYSIWAYEDHLDKYPQTKLICNLLNSVLRSVSGVTGRKITLKSFT